MRPTRVAIRRKRLFQKSKWQTRVIAQPDPNAQQETSIPAKIPAKITSFSSPLARKFAARLERLEIGKATGA